MINLEMEWREVPCTGESCIACKDPIFGKQYQLHSVINGQAKPLDQVVCASCYMEIEKDED
jgi:hypothetical protein